MIIITIIAIEIFNLQENNLRMKSINTTKHVATYIKQIKVEETNVSPIESWMGLAVSRSLSYHISTGT
jgi:hypothetical protein